MVFGALFKPKGKLVFQAQGNSMPGELVPFNLQVTAEEEIKARAVRVELTGVETYYRLETHSDGKRSSTRTVQKNEPFARIVKTVTEQPSLVQGIEQKWSSSIQLPADAAYTCRGKLVNIRWTIKAVLDVPGRADLSQELPLQVLGRSYQVSDKSIAPAEKTFKEVALYLKAPSIAAAGEMLKGQLILQINDKLSIRSIRTELVRVEQAGSRNSDETVATTRISDEALFNLGESPSFGFVLEVPAGAPPTAASQNSSLGWKIKAVVDRKMRSDFGVEQELTVYNVSGA